MNSTNPEDILSRCMPGEAKPMSLAEYEEDPLTLLCINCHDIIYNHRDYRWCE